ARLATAPSSVTSSGKASAPVSAASASSRSARRAAATTSNPSVRSRRTVAAPIPDEAPVTRMRRGAFMARHYPRSADADLHGVPAGRSVGCRRGLVAGLDLTGGVGGTHRDRVVPRGGVPDVAPLPPRVRSYRLGDLGRLPGSVVDADLDRVDPGV